MKYWNKDKDVRKRCWFRVTHKLGRHSKQEIKRWLQLQSSTGKFYYYYGSPNWWFERSEDAVLFSLKWGS